MQENVLIPSNFLTNGKMMLTLSKIDNSNVAIGVFLRLLLMATYHNGEVKLSEDSSYSINDLSRLCDCSENELNQLLKNYKAHQLIDFKDNIIVIKDWNNYCDEKSRKNQYMKGYREKQKLEKIKHGTISEIDDELQDFFESIWALYPIKRGKSQISLKQKKSLFSIGYEHIERAINRYINECIATNKEEKYWVMGSTFFNSRYADYLDENYQPLPTSNKKAKNNNINYLMSKMGSD